VVIWSTTHYSQSIIDGFYNCWNKISGAFALILGESLDISRYEQAASRVWYCNIHKIITCTVYDCECALISDRRVQSIGSWVNPVYYILATRMVTIGRLDELDVDKDDFDCFVKMQRLAVLDQRGAEYVER